MTRSSKSLWILATLLLLASPLLVGLGSRAPLYGADPEPTAERTPDFVVDGGTEVQLLSLAEARKAIIDPSDPFFEKLTPLEISLRLDEDVTALPREEALAKFRTFLQGEVMEWPEYEKRMLRTALPLIARACRKRCPEILPEKWRFIRTTGREELGTPYTRGNCIVIPDKVAVKLVAGVEDKDTIVLRNLDALGSLIVHETVHVWTRYHPIERDVIYREIGFHPIAPVTIHPSIEKIRLTNPDGPGWEHAITVKNPAGEECRAVLLLTSRAPDFQKGYAGVIPVLSFHLYPVTEGEKPSLVVGEDGKVVRWRPDGTTGFLDQVKRNTGFIYHPDEIIADNIAQLAFPHPTVADPDLLERLAMHVGGNYRNPKNTDEAMGQGAEGGGSKEGKPEPASHGGGDR